jgi:hypothetical protein
MIKTCHNAGFFSCCTVKLVNIIDFINSNKKLPDIVDSSELFKMYKKDEDKDKDITFDYFQDYNIVPDLDIIYSIDFCLEHQNKNYNYLDYKSIIPLVKKYFSPSAEINKIVDIIEKKYNIVYDNTLAVYYRGCDKYIETQLAPFDEFYERLLKIVDLYTNINILLQSDSADFIDYINDKKLKNITIINENKYSYNNSGIHYEQSSNENYYHMLNFLSTILIISRCKYIICGSGNVTMWTLFYRGNSNNVIQYFNGTWYNNMVT